MNRWLPEVISYYDEEATKLIAEKYGYSLLDALREFVGSRTHLMLEDKDYGLMAFGPGGVFDIWEAERVTGTPLNSVYVRDE